MKLKDLVPESKHLDIFSKILQFKLFNLMLES